MTCCRVLIGILALAGAGPLAADARADVPLKQELAKSHYLTGTKYYQIAKYRLALEEFRKAHSLEPMPGLQHNIARCHEVLGELKAAIKHYRLFLEQLPGSPKEAVVKLRIQSLEARLAQQPKAATSASPKPAPAAVPPAAPPDVGRRPTGRAWVKPTGWITLGVGGAALVAGAICGGMVSAKNQEHADNRDTLTYDELQQIVDQAEGYQGAQVGLLVAGGVLAAAGGGLLLWHYLGRGAERAKERVVVFPVISGSVGLAARAHF